jgi:hypothetical protein
MQARAAEHGRADAPALAGVAAHDANALKRRLAQRAAVALQGEPRLVVQVRVPRHLDNEGEVETARDAAAWREIVVMGSWERTAVKRPTAHVVVG